MSNERSKVAMTKAFVLIQTAAGRNKEVIVALSQLKGVKSADTVTGPYDIIAVIGGENLNDVGDLVTGKILPIAGISRTVTCLATVPSKSWEPSTEGLSH